jgi:mycothiol synthase
MRFRPPSPDDAPAVLGVVVARDLADIGIADYTLEDLRDEWGESSLDLSADAVVVESGDELVAYALLRRQGAFAVVHPAHENREIGARLLAWTERRARELGRDHYRQWVSAGNARADAMLRGAGYAPVRSYWRMARPLDGSEQPVTAPGGVRLRPLDVDLDAAGAHALDDASFAALPDYNPHSLEQFVDEHLRAHDLGPELSTVAELGDRMVGFALCRRWVQESAGFIDLLAVHPDHQRRGLGSVLLRTSFSRFAAAGLTEAQLGVASDNPRALALYERVGMHARFQTDVYERPVT